MQNNPGSSGNFGNQGNVGGTSGGMTGGNVGGMGGQKFVDRFEMAIMQFVILNKAQQGEVTQENLQSVFKGNLQMQGSHLQHCINQLVQENHLQKDGNKLRITDDGREDIQKLQHLVIELPNIVQQNQGAGGQRPGMTPQRTTGGQTGTSGGNVGGQSGTSGSTGGRAGTQGGNVGGQQGQPKGGR